MEMPGGRTDTALYIQIKELKPGKELTIISIHFLRNIPSATQWGHPGLAIDELYHQDQDG